MVSYLASLWFFIRYNLNIDDYCWNLSFLLIFLKFISRWIFWIDPFVHYKAEWLESMIIYKVGLVFWHCWFDQKLNKKILQCFLAKKIGLGVCIFTIIEWNKILTSLLAIICEMEMGLILTSRKKSVSDKSIITFDWYWTLVWSLWLFELNYTYLNNMNNFSSIFPHSDKV